MNGDIGVDIFFVISGFLISYILLKEKAKYGDIDFKHFLRNRFLRIWPALFAYVFFVAILLLISGTPVVAILRYISPLLFINNFTGKPLTHIWSVAVEFQFYLISPWIITKMETWKLPLVLCLFSTVLNFAITIGIC